MKWYLKVLKQYVDFDGRARRKEYWMFFLFNTIFAFFAMFFDIILQITFLPFFYGPLYLLYCLFTFLPGLAVSVRRLHDVGKSGWMYLIVLIPLIGPIWLFILSCTDGDKGQNKYGENPKENHIFSSDNNNSNNKPNKIGNTNPTKNKEHMEGFNQCSQGHFYKDNLSNCPYCPSGASSPSEKTEIIGTVKEGQQNEEIPTDKTQVFGGDSSVNVPNSGPSGPDPSLLKTTISGAPTPDSSNATASTRRKLRGWLVTFDDEDFGVDFKINEGRNSIGSKPNNDITVSDKEVSSSHALLLCRNDKFFIEDEMSTNGTFINGNEISPRQPIDLNDGDVIRFGNTNFLFRKAFK